MKFEEVVRLQRKVWIETKIMLIIQRVFKCYESKLTIQNIKLENYVKARLSALKLNQLARKITNFIKSSVIKIKAEKEEIKKALIQVKRRKAVCNPKKTVVYQRKATILNTLSEILKPTLEGKIDCIPIIYQIFSPPRLMNRALTPAEKVRLPTESSCMRSRDIRIKRSVPKFSITGAIKGNKLESEKVLYKGDLKGMTVNGNFWHSSKDSNDEGINSEIEKKSKVRKMSLKGFEKGIANEVRMHEKRFTRRSITPSETKMLAAKYLRID
jgi:hypothetical protein